MGLWGAQYNANGRLCRPWNAIRTVFFWAKKQRPERGLRLWLECKLATVGLARRTAHYAVDAFCRRSTKLMLGTNGASEVV